MSLTTTARPTASLPLGALHLVDTAIGTSAVLVTAAGELDAMNARELVDFVDQTVHGLGALVLDLGNLAFFGTEGLWAVNRVKAACVKQGTASAIVAGAAMQRVLRICDPYGALKVHASLDDAMYAVTEPAPRRLASTG